MVFVGVDTFLPRWLKLLGYYQTILPFSLAMVCSLLENGTAVSNKKEGKT